MIISLKTKDGKDLGKVVFLYPKGIYFFKENIRLYYEEWMNGEKENFEDFGDYLVNCNSKGFAKPYSFQSQTWVVD